MKGEESRAKYNEGRKEGNKEDKVRCRTKEQ